MDCIVKVIKGPDAGLSCQLQPGANLIGRSSRSVLKLTPPDISLEHVQIIRNGEDYVVENLSSSGTWIDNAKVTGQVKLRLRDQLRLSRDTVLRFESESGAGGGLLGDRRLLLGLAMVVLMGLGALVVMNPFGSSEVSDNDWNRVYGQIAPWIERQVAVKQLPADVRHLFREGWRLEQSQDYDQSHVVWLRLQLLLDSLDENRRQNLLAGDPTALDQMLHFVPGQSREIGEEELGGVMVQFVKRRLAWSSRQLKSSRLAP